MPPDWPPNSLEYTKERGDLCKHPIVLRLLHACERMEARQINSTPVPFPARADTDTDRVELTAKGMAARAAQELTPVAQDRRHREAVLRPRFPAHHDCSGQTFP